MGKDTRFIFARVRETEGAAFNLSVRLPPDSVTQHEKSDRIAVAYTFAVFSENHLFAMSSQTLARSNAA